jgi:hypothetical protein
MIEPLTQGGVGSRWVGLFTLDLITRHPGNPLACKNWTRGWGRDPTPPTPTGEGSERGGSGVGLG